MERFLHLVEKAGLEDDRQIQQLLAVAGDESSPDFLRRRARSGLRRRLVSELDYPFDRQSLDVGNGLKIGRTVNGFAYLEEEQLQNHLLAYGQTGSGKTTFFSNLMLQLDAPFWSFDLKQDYRHLANRSDLDLVVLPLEKLRLNPLRPPPGVPLNQWVQRFSEIFCDSQALLDASRNYLNERSRVLLRESGCMDGGCSDFPNIVDLRQNIRGHGINYTNKQHNYKVTVLNRLNGIIQDSFTTWNVEETTPLRNLLKRNVVFELDGFGRNVQNLVMEYLMAWVYSYRKHNNMRSEGLRHVFFLDESKTVFSRYKERQVDSGIPEIDLLTAKMREFGEGVVAGDQEVSKLTDSIKSNTGTKVMLSAAGGGEFSDFADAMDLSEFQRGRASSLSTGEAVVQDGDGAWFVELDHVEVEKDVDESVLEELMSEKWSQLVPETGSGSVEGGDVDLTDFS